MASVSRFLTTKLRLTVNEAKSAVARPEERKFLGFSISNDGSERRIAARDHLYLMRLHVPDRPKMSQSRATRLSGRRADVKMHDGAFYGSARRQADRARMDIAVCVVPPRSHAARAEQVAGAAGTPLSPDPRSPVSGDTASALITLLGALTEGSGSHMTPRWRKPDSNSWSRFEKSRPYKTRYTESESFGRREQHHSGGTKS
jgi:hypothetical protein